MRTGNNVEVAVVTEIWMLLLSIVGDQNKLVTRR